MSDKKTILISLILATVFVVGFCAFSSQAQAATYYVCDTGATCKDGGDSSWETGLDTRTKAQAIYKTTPWKTIQECANNVVAGDTCVVANGTYNNYQTYDGYSTATVVMSVTGTEVSPIVFKSENKWGAVLDGRGTDIPFSSNPEVVTSLGIAMYGVQNIGINYVTVQDFEIRNYGKVGGISIGGDGAPSSHVIIKGNHIHDIGRMNVMGGPFNPGGSGTCKNCSYVIFDGNVFHTLGRLNKYTTPVMTNDDCMFYKNRDTPSNNCWGHDHGIYAIGDNLTVKNNIFYDLKSGWAIQLGCDGGCGNNAIIVNNTFADPNPEVGYGTGHIWLWGNPQDLIIRNNIFYNPQSYAIGCAFNAPSNGNSIAENNIIYDAYGMLPATTCPLNNFTFNNNRIINPLFNEGTNVYTLKSGSPAINTGTPTLAPLYDILGILRSSFGLPDIGAYEYTGSVASSADVDGSGSVNIKDIQACIRVITNSQTDQNIIAKCQAVAPDILVTNIKDIQGIIRKILNPN